MVNHHRTARGQANLARKSRLDLAFNLEFRKQWGVVAVELELAQVMRHYILHKLLRILMNFTVIDDDLADVITQVVAQGADDQIAFLVN